MSKPNIVLILTDDQGTWSLGSYGNPEVITPNLDTLAEKGIRFDNFYCTSPVCSPARASVMTGKMPSQHGILDWLGGGAINKEEMRDLPIPYKRSLSKLAEQPENPDAIGDDEMTTFSMTESYQRYSLYELSHIDFLDKHKTFAEILNEHGYRCGLSGKWHLGSAKEPHRGFDFWEPIIKGGTNYDLGSFFKDGKPVIKDGYVTDLITEEALRFLDQTSDETPFFLSVNFNAPHDPWLPEEHPQEVLSLYDNCDLSYYPDEPRHPDQDPKRTQPKSEAQKRQYQQVYYTCVTAMDRCVGQIIEKLRQQNRIDNTLVLFLSDNGMNLGHHGIWGKGNGTFPVNMYETSVKVPFIAYGYGVENTQHDCQTLVSQYDIFPTILELAEIPQNEIDSYTQGLPGSSMLSLFSGTKTHIRDEVVVFDEYGPTRMVRTQTHKLIYRTPFGPHELYDLQKDPDERNNVIDDVAYACIKSQLFETLSDWFACFSCAQYDGRQFPVDGNGQLERLENYGTSKKVFRKF